MPLRSNAVTNVASSSAIFSIGSRVRSNVESPVPFSRSAMTTETGSCAAADGRGRLTHHPPPAKASPSTVVPTRTRHPGIRSRRAGRAVPASRAATTSVALP